MTQHQMLFTDIPDIPPLTYNNSSKASGFSRSFSFTTSGDNRALIVGIATFASNHVTAVYYNNVPLTFVGATDGGADDARTELWALSNPDSGTFTVLINSTAGPVVTAGATYFNGAHQTTASLTGVYAGAGGTDNSPTKAVTSATGEIVIDCVSAYDDLGGAHSHTVGAGQTERWSYDTADVGTWGGSTEAGASSVTMSWSLTGNIPDWSLSAVSVKPADGQTLTHGGTTSINDSSASLILTWPHTCDNEYRGIIVGVHFSSSDSVTSVKYDGVSLTSIGSVSGGGDKIEQFKLSAPSADTNMCEITMSGSTTYPTATAVSFHGVHQTTASLTGTQASTYDATSQSSVSTNVTSARSETVVDFVKSGAGDTLTVGANQHSREEHEGTFIVKAGSSVEVGATTTTMSWSSEGAGPWHHLGVAVKPP